MRVRVKDDVMDGWSAGKGIGGSSRYGEVKGSLVGWGGGACVGCW